MATSKKPPKVTIDKARTQTLRFRATPEEAERLKTAAKEDGASGLSTWLRQLALKRAREVLGPG